MKYRALRWSVAAWVMLIAGCDNQPPTKNPGPMIRQGVDWSETLMIDPSARIGSEFWITYHVSGAAGDIEAATIQFDLPRAIDLVRGELIHTNLQFQQNEDYTATIWVRIDQLDEPVIIGAHADGIFRSSQQAAYAGSSRYLIPDDGAILFATDLPSHLR